MKITLTAEHIKNGKRNTPDQCAFTLALIDAGYFPVKVEYDGFSTGDKFYEFPKWVQILIEFYDDGEFLLPPYEFEVEEKVCVTDLDTTEEREGIR